MLDAGIGAFSKLQLAIDYTALDAVVISHMHADHFFDLVPFRYALKYGGRSVDRRIPLWLPPGGRIALEALRKAVAVDAASDFFDCVFAVREYDPEAFLEVEDVVLRFRQTRHYVDAFAVRAQCNGGAVTYSADTAPCEAVVELARKSALFLCEAGLGLDSEQGERGHSSAEEAGAMAECAGVKRLLLTHYPAAYSPEALVEAAGRTYSGIVEAASDGMERAV